MPEERRNWTEQQVPVSALYDDPYFSVHDGLAESRYVFLAGNGLPEGFFPGFHIAELGFGTGLNAIVAWMAWQEAGHAGPLTFTSFEAHPMPAADRARALKAWPEIADHAQALTEALGEGLQADLDGLRLRIVEGFAQTTLPQWEGAADAWFLDGFNPQKNPDLWSEDLMAEVARHTRPKGRFATYTAAGHVRRSLQAAGFTVERKSGYGTKRHMTVGWL